MVETKGKGVLVVEASSLGWKPGYFPTRWAHIASGDGGISWSLTRIERDRDGDIVAAHYIDDDTGKQLVVIND
jgi:hypothetical protein